jgi:hypothetical protein
MVSSHEHERISLPRRGRPPSSTSRSPTLMRAWPHASFLAAGFEPVSMVSRQAVIMGPADIGEVQSSAPSVPSRPTSASGGSLPPISIPMSSDAVIGDYVTFAPRVSGCNGNVTVKDLAYTRCGCGHPSGEYGRPTVTRTRAVVGMGAVVLDRSPMERRGGQSGETHPSTSRDDKAGLSAKMRSGPAQKVFVADISIASGALAG